MSGLFFIFNIFLKNISEITQLKKKDKTAQFIYVVIGKRNFYSLSLFRLTTSTKNIK